MATPNGIALPVYAPCSATVDVRGTTVHLFEETDYPFAGEIHIKIEKIENESHALDFALRLRLPSWAETYTLTYNGTQTEVETTNGYLILNKAFAPGDQITLSLPLKLRLVPEASGGASVHYGALLLALPIDAETHVVRGKPPFADYEFLPRGEWRFGIGEYSLANATITHAEPGELPFDTEHAPLTVCLPLAPAPHWKREKSSAGPVPEPFSAATSDFIPQKLIPYGCTQLRVTQFPIVIDQEE